MIGTVKFWNLEKGYGFLKIPGEQDVFVHLSGLTAQCGDYLVPGDLVSFRIVVDEKTRRQKAIEVNPRQSTPATMVREMQSLRKMLDDALRKQPGANEHLCELRHVLTELEAITAT